MNRTVGFDRKLQLDWLDITVAQCHNEDDPNCVAQNLNRLLTNVIGGCRALTAKPKSSGA
jgi:hypothetical protein